MKEYNVARTVSKISKDCVKKSLIEGNDRTKNRIGVQSRPRSYTLDGKHGYTIDRLSKCFLPRLCSLTEWPTTSNQLRHCYSFQGGEDQYQRSSCFSCLLEVTGHN